MDTKDIEFVNELIKHGMLPLYLVGLISADNIDSKETWQKNHERIIKLKKCLEEIEFDDKSNYLEKINDGIEIIERELKKHD